MKENIMENLFVTVEVRIYINTTPHDINCLNSLGELVVIPASGILINAKNG